MAMMVGHHHGIVAHGMAIRDHPGIRHSRTRGMRSTSSRVGRELGVRYLLEGSIRRAGGRVRIAGQLIEAATGSRVWADHDLKAHSKIFSSCKTVLPIALSAPSSRVFGAPKPCVRWAKPTDHIAWTPIICISAVSIESIFPRISP